jgi:SMC interacting uncharacterized protein involved in chromosome segregation
VRKKKMSIATKEQERKALEQIREIVKGLGEDSYIGMAFEGCFEIAESNIDNDFGSSMLAYKEACEIKEGKIKALEGSIKELEERLEFKEVGINMLKEMIFYPVELIDIRNAFIQQRERLVKEIGECSRTIIERAEEPESEEFKDAVIGHRSTKRELKQCEERIDRVASIEELVREYEERR